MPYKVVDSWDKVVSQQDAIEYGRNKGANTAQVLPKYTEVSTVKGAVNLRNCDKAMSKCEREWVRYLYWCLGLLTVIALAFGIARLMGVA